MKLINKLLLAILAFVAAFALLPPAFAGSESFSATNNISNGGASILGWPTNNAGKYSGGAIALKNYSQVGFYFSGYQTSATVSTNTVILVRAYTDNQPTETQWDTTNQITFSWILNGAGNHTFLTNLGEAFVYPANWIGIRDLTNSCTSSVFTNVDVGIVKKIIPVYLGPR